VWSKETTDDARTFRLGPLGEALLAAADEESLYLFFRNTSSITQYY
jgi:hypothetical protein